MQIGQRQLDDGREITVYAMLYTFRLCIGPAGWPTYDDAWCYEKPAQALRAATQWDGHGDPPGRWIKHVGTERRREWAPDGTLVREDINAR